MTPADVLRQLALVLERRARARYVDGVLVRWDEVGYHSIFAAQSTAAYAD